MISLLRLLCPLVLGAYGLDAPPTFVVDLSKPPASRWNGAVQKVLERHSYEYSFRPVFNAHAPLFDKVSAAQRRSIGAAVQRHYPETAAELQGISRQFAAIGHQEVGFEYLALWLYFHELAHTELAKNANIITRECTAIVAESETGVTFHGGNMDQTPQAARNLTLRVKFIDEAGDTVFQGVDWYTLLSTGVSRAVKRNLATVQENWRHAEIRSVDAVLADIEAGVTSQMLVFRSLFTAAHRKPMSFDEFVDAVTVVRLAAPFYVVASGPDAGNGVVIARNLTGSVNTARLAAPNERSSPDDFFLAQTNYEHWLRDSQTDPRRTAAERTLRGLGREEGASLVGLLAVTSTYPVHNPDTVYTALMSAATGELHAYVREAMCPVDPGAAVVQDGRYCQSPSAGSPLPVREELIIS